MSRSVQRATEVRPEARGISRNKLDQAPSTNEVRAPPCIEKPPALLPGVR